jgi:hypothetical protein
MESNHHPDWLTFVTPFEHIEKMITELLGKIG